MRACLNTDAEYLADGDQLIRLDPQGGYTHLDGVRLLIHLDHGVIAHGTHDEVEEVFDRLTLGTHAARLHFDLDRAVAFRLDADETVALRVNKALRRPDFAADLARRVLLEHGAPALKTRETDRASGAVN